MIIFTLNHCMTTATCLACLGGQLTASRNFGERNIMSVGQMPGNLVGLQCRTPASCVYIIIISLHLFMFGLRIVNTKITGCI